MTIKSIWHINDSQTREDTRLAPNGVFTPGASSGLATSSGVVPTQGNPLNLTNTAEMTAQVEIGRAVVQGLTTQGAYPVVVTSAEAVAFDDGDASNPRIDTVAIVIRDDTYDSTGFTDVRVVVVKGTAASSPVAPAMPTTASLPLWNVTVPAGTSAGSGGIDWGSAKTDRRSYVVAVGGISVGSQAGSYAGQFRDSGGATGTLSRYNGTSWESALRLDSAGTLAVGDLVMTRDSLYDSLALTGGFEARKSGVSTLYAFSARKLGELDATWKVTIDGTIGWGPGGSVPPDTNLYREAASVLKTDDVFKALVETTTTGITGVASGWGITNFYGRRTAGVVTVDLYANRTGADIAVVQNTNITDINLCTLPAGWRPQHSTISGFFDNGVTGLGGVVVGTDGQVSIRSSAGNIDNNTNLRMQFVFIQVN